MAARVIVLAGPAAPARFTHWFVLPGGGLTFTPADIWRRAQSLGFARAAVYTLKDYVAGPDGEPAFDLVWAAAPPAPAVYIPTAPGQVRLLCSMVSGGDDSGLVHVRRITEDLQREEFYERLDGKRPNADHVWGLSDMQAIRHMSER